MIKKMKKTVGKEAAVAMGSGNSSEADTVRLVLRYSVVSVTQHRNEYIRATKSDNRS